MYNYLYLLYLIKHSVASLKGYQTKTKCRVVLHLSLDKGEVSAHPPIVGYRPLFTKIFVITTLDTRSQI